MSRVLTNNTTLSYAIESAIGVLPGSPTWHILEPNSLGSYGATITTVARDPISRNRQRRKGTVTDLDSAVDWEGDLTLNHFTDFAEGFAFATAVNQTLNFVGSTTTATGYTVTAINAAQAAKLQFVGTGPISLVHAKGYATPANNGLKPLSADAADTDTEIQVAGLSVEVPPTNATLDIAGIRAEAGDFMSLCKNKELACEVTIQPLERYDLDAAILFSDILTIPDAMGLGLYFETGEGPKFERPTSSLADVK